MQDNSNSYKEWDRIWTRKNCGSKFINMGRNAYNSFFKKLLMRRLRRDSQMLELGCGTATIGMLLSPFIKRYTGLDLSDVILEKTKKLIAKRDIHNMDLLKGDCRNVPWSHKFDLVWSQGLVEHFNNAELIVKEHFKATKPGGTVLISVPYTYSYLNIWYYLTRPKFLRRFWPWTDQTFFSAKSLGIIGKRISPNARSFVLQPFVLGIVILEIKKPKAFYENTV
ncbi:MAG: class I SAM-dependent methyltransferase [Candidatus Omnitrophica bacterium]|nr:class I SAM-dependent methyltransferase [Candidatus Omnitrophota bacterium]